MAKSLMSRKQSSEERIDEFLSAYLDGVLALEERAELEARLQHEPALVSRLEGLRSTKKALARLPQMDVPRNFILSPAMVAPPRAVSPRRQRRTWPVFGWATAAVTLVFLFVFAGDLFVISPSARPEQAIIETEAAQRMVAEKALSSDDAREPETIAPATQASEIVFEAEPTSAKGEAEAVAAEAPMVEFEITLEAEASVAAAEQGELYAPATADEESLATARILATPAPGGGGGERPAAAATETELSAMAPAPEGVAMTATPMLMLKQATSVPPSALGNAVETEGGAEGSPEPTALPSEDLELREPKPPAATGSETTPDAVAVIAPIDAIREEDARQDADRVLAWLRWIELGLAVVAIGLAAATLILRRREM